MTTPPVRVEYPWAGEVRAIRDRVAATRQEHRLNSDTDRCVADGEQYPCQARREARDLMIRAGIEDPPVA